MRIANKEIKIVFLYAELVGYVVNLINFLAKEYGVKIYLVRQDKNMLSKDVGFDLHMNVTVYNKSAFTNSEALDVFINEIKPDLVCISGWRDKDYLQVVKKLKKIIPIVCMSDNKWNNTFRQRLGALFSYYFCHRYFTHFWVPGPRQYTFARNMGYPDNRIKMNFYTADTNLVNETYYKSLEIKKNKFPHVFLYIGRFSPEKGCDLLIKAFEELNEEYPNDWKLVLIGNGVLNISKNIDKLIVKEFMSQLELQEVLGTSGVFCMPSLSEQWGVSIHEASCCGLPLLISDVCGSISTFLIEGYNGFKFEAGNKLDMKEKMKILINTSDEDLIEMGNKSHILGQRINVEISAASLMSIFIN